MIGDGGLGGAVIARDPCLGTLKFDGHWLGLDGLLETGELHVHIDDGATAKRTFIGGRNMLPVTRMVDTVAATHKDHRLWRIEEIIAADWTIAIGCPFNASMTLLHRYGNAHAASLVCQ